MAKPTFIRFEVKVTEKVTIIVFKYFFLSLRSREGVWYCEKDFVSRNNMSSWAEDLVESSVWNYFYGGNNFNIILIISIDNKILNLFT